MVGVFGAPHFVSPDIQGSSVVSISIDQQNTRNIIITCKDNIKIYEASYFYSYSFCMRKYLLFIAFLAFLHVEGGRYELLIKNIKLIKIFLCFWNMLQSLSS